MSRLYFYVADPTGYLIISHSKVQVHWPHHHGDGGERERERGRGRERGLGGRDALHLADSCDLRAAPQIRQRERERERERERVSESGREREIER